MITLLSWVSLLGVVSSATASSHSSFSIPNTFPNLTACASENLQYSCENTTVVRDSCCSVVGGGLVLQTQFWDTWTGLEKEGQLLPKGSWTIHGLWPDNCDGSFNQYCDLSRQYDPSPDPAVLPDGTVVPPYKGPSVETFIKDFGRDELLDFMNTYWVNQGASNSDFWGHEFSKHATCTSTFDVACYGSTYQKHEEVINFFDSAIRAWKMYPTYDILAAFALVFFVNLLQYLHDIVLCRAGIIPSNKTTYSLSQLQGALKAQTGATPYLGCEQDGTALSEVWYFHHVRGSEQYGNFKALDSTTPSTCNATAPIHYFERTATSEHVVG